MADRILALGFFDGVHIGHAALLRRTVELANSGEYSPAVLSFDTHPASVVLGKPIPLLCDFDARRYIIARDFDIHDMVKIHFEERMRRMSWQDFAAGMRDEFHAAGVVVGDDFRFGFKGGGTAELLRQFCADNGLICDVIPRVSLDGVTVSSSFIRELVAEGDLERARDYLGHPHLLISRVISGHGIGRSMGAPTINMQIPDGVVIPRFGVYATRVTLPDGSRYIGVTNVGVRPTVSGGQAEQPISIETFIMDFEGDLYGELVVLEFEKFMRPELKLSGLEELSRQIARDAEGAREYFAVRGM